MNQSDQVFNWGFERYHFGLRRLHSLTGIVPVGLFLAEHLLTCFGFVLGGPQKYNRDVMLINQIPWLRLVEWVFIFLPLAFHAGYGCFITLTGKSNVRRYPFGGNIRYTLQRVAGIVTLIFVAVHLLKFRFNYLLPDGHGFDDRRATEMTVHGFTNPWVVGFYVVGISSAVFHFANGIWTAMITWGVTLGPRAQRRAGYVCAAIGIVLAVMGLSSLFCFHAG